MKIPEWIAELPDYPFPRLRRLLDKEIPRNSVIDFSIGEPRHPIPEWISSSVFEASSGFGRYPPNYGSPELLSAISKWVQFRSNVSLNPEQEILALNGSREGLFNASIALNPAEKNGRFPYILIPNPLYPAYAAGAAAAGAYPYFVPARKETKFMPDFAGLPKKILNQTTLLYCCSPSNPQGAIASTEYLKSLLLLAEEYGFRILSDECYSEIYQCNKPTSLLQVAAEMNADLDKVVIFNSLSKRSSLPGLRSGFAAGGQNAITAMKKMKSYGGAPIPSPLLATSVKAWSDEIHVEKNRQLYQAKYLLADQILSDCKGYHSPEGGLFLWLEVEDGEQTALRLWQELGLRVVPGAYFGRTVDGYNPGADFIRVALVADKEELVVGLERLRAGI